MSTARHRAGLFCVLQRTTTTDKTATWSTSPDAVQQTSEPKHSDSLSHFPSCLKMATLFPLGFPLIEKKTKLNATKIPEGQFMEGGSVYREE